MDLERDTTGIERQAACSIEYELQCNLPVTDVEPASKLEADFLEVRDFPHAEFLVQRDARGIRQRNAANGDVNSAIAEEPKQLGV